MIETSTVQTLVGFALMIWIAERLGAVLKLPVEWAGRRLNDKRYVPDEEEEESELTHEDAMRLYSHISSFRPSNGALTNVSDLDFYDENDYLSASRAEETPQEPVEKVEPKEEKINLPADVIAFCDEESETWAQDDCKSRARERFQTETSDWNVVHTSLMREYGVVK